MIEQLLRAIRKYDPEYNLKLKQIVEMIDDKFAQPKFTLAAANRHLGFDAVGHLRLLIRREYLEAAGKGEYERTSAWPPAVRLFSKPIGITNCIQTWFRYYLEQWISSSMRQLETKEEFTPSIAAGNTGLDRLNHHPVIQTLRSRLPHGLPAPRAEPRQDAFSAAARNASKSAAAACAIT
jgi:hypothetical protein